MLMSKYYTILLIIMAVLGLNGVHANQVPDYDEGAVQNLIEYFNNAEAEDLNALPGIGAVKSEDIINKRKANEFNSLEDIYAIDGVGVKTVEKLLKEFSS